MGIVRKDYTSYYLLEVSVMKVSNRDLSTEFKKVPVGSIFQIPTSPKFFIKTASRHMYSEGFEQGSEEVNCLCLDDGTYNNFGDSAAVTLCPHVELVVG